MQTRTKQELKEALKRVLRKKSIFKITIKDITEECGVNRMTFYYHFQDIYELVEWSWRDDAEMAFRGMDTHAMWWQGYFQVFQLLLDDKEVVRNLYREHHLEHIKQSMCAFTVNLMMELIEESAGDMEISREDKEFIAEFYKHVFVGITLDWIKGGMKKDPKKIIKQLNVLMDGHVKGAVQAYQVNKNII